MLDYEWGNPSAIMLTGDESTQDSDQSRQIFENYTAQSFNETLVNPSGFAIATPQQQQLHHHQLFGNPHPQAESPAQTHHIQSLYDPRAYVPGYSAAVASSPAMLTLEPEDQASGVGSAGFFVVPKSEPVGMDFMSRIGLNLGGRTYFSSAEDDFVNRLYRRPRALDPGSVNSPRCQAEGCNADLTHAKHYHRRHKVCEFHSKAATVFAAGLTQRFCQQCSRFHLLSEFDNGKRSCRKRLADHNRRRRKNQQPSQQNSKSQPANNRTSSSENLGRSPSDSVAHSSSSVTVAISPQRMSLDCFPHRSSYQAATTSSTSTTSLFFTNG